MQSPSTTTRRDLLSADGVRLSVQYLPGPPGAPALVLCHGFTGSVEHPTTRRIGERFRRYASVYALDFRGHGRSAGRSSVGRDEHLDVDAAMAAARADGHRRVDVVGFSMGASIALRHAALGTHLPDAVVSVSAPARWFIRDSTAMRRVHWMIEHPLGPAVGRVMGVRLSEPWAEVPQTPLELMPRIAPIPVLLVHGTADHYFPISQAHALQAASDGHATLWIERGMRHAESGATPDLVDRIGEWLQGLTVPASKAG